MKLVLRSPALNPLDRSVLFFDIDGVFNSHERHGNGYCGTRKDCVTRLNRLIARTDCLLVASSAWRYLVLSGSMTVVGFENMLLTHGLDCRNRIYGVTRPDATPEITDRGAQINEFLASAAGAGIRAAAAVDDREFDIPQFPIAFVRTDPWKGLDDAAVDKLVLLLGERPVKADDKPHDWRPR